jgi:hypothetical protein
MDTMNPDSSAPGREPAPGRQPAPGRVGRGRRIAASAAAAVVLVGGGVGIGVALTGGASAATGSNPGPAAAAASGPRARECVRIALALSASGHPVAARRVLALCEVPLLRLAAIGGIHGEVTFHGKSGFRTLAFERGTVESVTSSAVTVQAADGTTWTWDFQPNTIVREAGHKVPENTLADGDQVFAGGQVVNGVYDARLIRIRKAA